MGNAELLEPFIGGQEKNLFAPNPNYILPVPLKDTDFSTTARSARSPHRPSTGYDPAPAAALLSSSARSDIAVSYAALSYRTPEGELPASLAACWWEDISFFAHLWRLFHVREYTAVLNFGVAPVMNHDRKLLAAELRDRVEEKFEPVV